MSKQIVSAVVCGLVFIAAFSSCYGASMAPLCQPGIWEEMPAHIKNVCMALENTEHLSTALKSYISNEAATLVTKQDELANNYAKRTDVDHVFLRFGKRR